MTEHKDIDEISGTETTGHEWDGIHELNTPLPRWWLYTFYITIVWAIVYMVLYPALPLLEDFSRGTLGYSSRGELSKSIEAATEAQSELRGKLAAASLADIQNDPQLLNFAKAGGKAAFKVNCIQCHGSGAEGSFGNPNLNDDDWLWGGKLETIQQTILHGVRFEEDDDTRVSDMPAFGKDGMLDDAQIEAVADHVLALSDSSKKSSEMGAKLFGDNCASCHGANGEGNREFGAPSLNDHIWLYAGDKETVKQTIYGYRKGVMPAWAHRLDALTIKQLTLYVHSLGGGE